MRERLIELLKQVREKCASTSSKDCKNCSGYGKGYACINALIADYLLADGWMRPPCKVGDVVYQVTRTFISEFRVRFIEIATCGNLFLHTDLISGIVYTGEVFSESEIGKTVFLTREEAETTLVNYESSKIEKGR